MRKTVMTAAAICVMVLLSMSISSGASADESKPVPKGWIADGKFFVEVEGIHSGMYYLYAYPDPATGVGPQDIGDTDVPYNPMTHGPVFSYAFGEETGIPTSIQDLPQGSVVRFGLFNYNSDYSYYGSFIKGSCTVWGCKNKDCNVHACDDWDCFDCPHGGTERPAEDYILYAGIALAAVAAVAVTAVKMRKRK